ncbi:MAG: hypothetical protein CMF52_07055 [Legionellales bacterium]|nr:hypothetical protein [Legionellales bacterium]|tara:strand:+ start:3782 stop:4093 length:312 start_codon:yes stop_codon:yes gene_type:complete
MSLLDWLIMNLVFDISFVVFCTAFIYKLVQHKKQIKQIEQKIEKKFNLLIEEAKSSNNKQEAINTEIKATFENKIVELEDKTNTVIRNPRLARKKFHEKVNIN